MQTRERARAKDGGEGENPAAVAAAVPGKRALTDGLEAGPGATRAVLQRAIGGGTVPLPYASSIQRAFGKHDVSGVQAHVDGAAAAELGAKGFAAGDHVVLAPGADLFVVAHEVAHIVQQRAGISSADAAHEDHANEVAAAVVAGRSAEPLLDRYGAAGRASPSAAHAPVQLYRDALIAEKPYRVSANGRIAVNASTARSHEMYLDEELITTSSGLLEAAGSYVRLAKGEGTLLVGETTLAAAKPVVAPPEKIPQKGGLRSRINKLRGDTMKLPSDCNEAARVIMGVGDGQSDTNERAMTNGSDEPHGRNDLMFVKEGTKSGKNATDVENTGLTALRTKLTEYVATVETLEQSAARTYFLEAMVPIATNKQKGPALIPQLMQTLARDHADLYNAFIAFAGVDAKAMPKVGEALVTFRPEGDVPDTHTHAPKLFRAMVTAAKWLQEQEATRELGTSFLEQLGEDENAHTYLALVTLAPKLSSVLKSHGGGEHDGKVEDAKLWNKHWGGVVATDDTDYLTLENDALTKGEGETNTAWGFSLYGTVTAGQSFHEQMMGTGDFGDLGHTVRYRRQK
ncbi:MAG TPA: DUF4157 domain-containing protein [Kofleriaceae bacterium]|jgi:hypothetical protein